MNVDPLFKKAATEAAEERVVHFGDVGSEEYEHTLVVSVGESVYELKKQVAAQLGVSSNLELYAAGSQRELTRVRDLGRRSLVRVLQGKGNNLPLFLYNGNPLDEEKLLFNFEARRHARGPSFSRPTLTSVRVLAQIPATLTRGCCSCLGRAHGARRADTACVCTS